MEGEQKEPPEHRAVRMLGLGFDLTSDFRLKYAKGYPGRRLVVLDEENTDDLVFPGGLTVRGISRDIGCDKGDRIRFCSDVLEFNQMSELLNQKSLIQGKVPSGYFNALFGLSGAWLNDTKETKHLAFNGYFISSYNLHLRASALTLCNEVKRAVPSSWEPAALSRFIRTYGTHIIVELGFGGQDVICIRQNHYSIISPSALKVHLEDLGDCLFTDGNGDSPLNHMTRGGNNKVPEVFFKILRSNNLMLTSHSESSTKDGLTIIYSKRGGDPYLYSHHKWLQTVPNNPDAILFKFVPITSLLTGIPGSGYLSHAINLYLRYKPDPDELQNFLEFQVPRRWVPMYNELNIVPQHPQQRSPTLRFRLFGPKLHINTSQVSSNRKPSVGLRLYLEGPNCNHLAIHIQHLSSVPGILSSITSSKFSQWQSSEDSGHEFVEPIQWNSYSRLCSAPVKHNPKWSETVAEGAFIVAGAQLVTRGRWLKKCLHLRLLFTHIPGCTVRKTEWARAPSGSNNGSLITNISAVLSSTFSRRENPRLHRKETEAAAMDSGVFDGGPPVRVQSQKLLGYVDMKEAVRGANDAPGHWLVVGAKLVKEGGKIGLHVKFALLNYCEG